MLYSKVNFEFRLTVGIHTLQMHALHYNICVQVKDPSIGSYAIVWTHMLKNFFKVFTIGMVDLEGTLFFFSFSFFFFFSFLHSVMYSDIYNHQKDEVGHSMEGTSLKKKSSEFVILVLTKFYLIHISFTKEFILFSSFV